MTFNEFYKYFGERAEETGDTVASMFIEWTNDMKDRGLRPATINHHLMGMRTFMYWCMDEERQYIDRFKIRLVKVQEEMPKDYTSEEIYADTARDRFIEFNPLENIARTTTKKTLRPKGD